MKDLKQIIDEKLANSSDTEAMKKIINELIELADKKGASEAEMKEILRTNLEKE